jgi:hypothetical protein
MRPNSGVTFNSRDMMPIPENGFISRNSDSRPIGNFRSQSWFDFAASIKYIFAVFFEPYPSGSDEEET